MRIVTIPEVTISGFYCNSKLLHAYVTSRQKARNQFLLPRSIRRRDNDLSNDKKEIASILNDQFRILLQKKRLISSGFSVSY